MVCQAIGFYKNLDLSLIGKERRGQQVDPDENGKKQCFPSALSS